jgi:2-keto-4-pentenoate hydratase/2-oxohepta-3-ene-1,7-dioic acid hydratase in catechol pathway
VRLVTFVDENELVAGVVVDDVVVPALEAAADIADSSEWASSVRGILQQDREQWDRLADRAAASKEIGRPLAGLTLVSPVPDPQKIICIGLNYGSHVEEAKKIPGAPDQGSAVPILFPKFTTSLVGHEANVLIPASTQKMDWEAELAVIISRKATRVSQDVALDYVGGYTAFNDVSARDLQLQTPQWTAGKACDTFGPCGPWVVTADEIPDPQDLRVQARLNGKTMQDARTDTMIFPVARLIEFISSVITLVPGDIIATGTPAGVGVGMDPPVFMHADDVIEVEVERIGVLRNTLVPAPVAAGAPLVGVDA